MIDLLSPLPPEPLLPSPNHHRLAFRTLLGALDAFGLAAIVFSLILGEYWIATFLIVGLLAITVVAVINHKHNHDHIWLLAGATIVTVLLTAYLAVAVIAQ